MVWLEFAGRSGDALLTFSRFGGSGLSDRADGEEFMAARLAAQGRQSEDAAEESHRSRNVFGRNTLQVKIATNSAMGVFPLAHWDRAGAETNATCGATPRYETGNGVRNVLEAAATGAPAGR